MFSNSKLSIHIKDNMIKFVEGKMISDNEIKIIKHCYLDIKSIYFEEQRLNKNFSSEMILNSEDNIAIIKKIVSKHKFSANKIYLTIGSDKIITRVIQLPKLSLNDLNSLIKMEVHKYFPIDLNKYLIDYKILNAINEEDKIFYKILVYAIPKKIIREYTDLLVSAGLKPVLVDIHSNSISRIFNSLEFEDVAILDTSADKAELMILDRGVFYIQTTFPFVFKNYSDLYREPQNFDVSLLDNEIKNLSKNIKNYIDFYLSKNEDKSIDTLYITGDIALVSGIKDKFVKELGIDVIQGFENLIKVKTTKRSKDFDANFYCANIGTLLRGE